MEFLILVIPLISGGLAGAVANIFVTRRRQRIDAALKLIDYFFSHYGGIAEVKAILKDTSQLSNPVKENLVREIGDWFNLVSFLCDRNVSNSR